MLSSSFHGLKARGSLNLSTNSNGSSSTILICSLPHTQILRGTIYLIPPIVYPLRYRVIFSVGFKSFMISSGLGFHKSSTSGLFILSLFIISIWDVSIYKSVAS